MLHIAKKSDRCCSTCVHWHGVRVSEDDGHVYALRHGEAVCEIRWDLGDIDPTCPPLTRPSNSGCPHWGIWRDAPPCRTATA